MSDLSSLKLEEVVLDQLKPHPRNYRKHPDDETAHLMESIKSNGIYRNVVIAQDGTILAGHGVVGAARKLGIQSIPVYRTDYGPDDPRALKLLVSDNEISHLAESDDRLLTEMLKELNETDIGLFGTGYDEMMLANLLFVTRPASEIADLDAAAQWVGMPEYDEEGGPEVRGQIVLNFESDEARREFCQKAALTIDHKEKRVTLWWPIPPRDDVKAVRFVDRKERADA